MKLKKVLIAGVTIALGSFALVGCSSSSSSSSKTKETTSNNANSVLRISEKDVISTMDSSLATDTISSQNLNNVMDGLYRYKGKTIAPAIATKVVKPTNNGLTYTFPLRKDAKWSNGDPVTANDFVFAWKRTVNPETKSQYAYIYEGIANAKDITAGKKPVDSLGVKAIDDHTFEVTLEKPIPYFSQLMSAAFFFPQNEKTVNKWGKQYGTNSDTLVFNGPYKLVNWKGSDNSWTEEKNDSYWNAKSVNVKKIQYQVVKDPTTAVNLYQSNKLDRALLTGDTAKQMKGSDGYGITKKSSTFYLSANQQKNEIFKNANVRRALSMSVNRKQLTSKVLGDGSTVNNSIVASNIAFDPNDKTKDFVKETSSTGDKYTKYDPAEAKKLWEKGLKETGNTGKTFNLVLLGDDTDNAKKQSEFLQNQLEKLPGLKLTLSNVPFKSRLTRAKSGDFDLVVYAWNADFPDPINFLTLVTKDSSYNVGKWENEKFDALVDKSLTDDANNPTKRWKDMMDAQDILNEEQGVAPLYQLGEAWMTNKRVKNMTLNPGSMYDMNLVELKD
ncbi:peptide ABC transporter substrate-binding protein [Xylocopilactobacillus apicola]|uniref:Peptide ABC transporter substrate-binding protein n=1 Tax=Xylocopilactobacillus apicola TaxID=2932184 RepID=A0AAU9DEC8_9LACO|nr:peptide ABC transporter substrate-binding protein [Xylocopilactobacillus apicola]BDR59222.1 peptide ABC transporter substrate-binding protein [Xylocopilactobacillus apicola]